MLLVLVLMLVLVLLLMGVVMFWCAAKSAVGNGHPLEGGQLRRQLCKRYIRTTYVSH